MLYNLIPLILILICLAVIIIVVVRKFPQLASLDISTLPQERDAQVKKDIIDRRLIRVLSKYKNFFIRLWRPIYTRLRALFGKVYHHAYRSYKDLESDQIKQAEKVRETAAEAKEKKVDIVSTSLAEGKELLDSEDYTRAETKYIDVLTMDKKNLEAFEGLAHIYSARKEVDNLKETLLYMLKIIKNNKKAPEGKSSQIQYRLAEVFIEEKDYSMALEYIKQCLLAQPNNPKYLDTLVQLAIIVQDVTLAKEALVKLSEANPENHKLEEFAKEISEMG